MGFKTHQKGVANNLIENTAVEVYLNRPTKNQPLSAGRILNYQPEAVSMNVYDFNIAVFAQVFA